MAVDPSNDPVSRSSARRDLFILSFCATCVFLILVGLGTWQLQRLEWKEALITRIEARASAEPVELSEALAKFQRGNSDIEYLRVRTKGEFLHSHERHLFNVVKGVSGWQIITPLVTTEDRFVLVDRGFVPDQFRQPSKRMNGQLKGMVDVVGLIRNSGSKETFTPDNNVEANDWYWRDLEAMAASVLTSQQQEKLVPFFVAAEATKSPGSLPRGGSTRLELPNKHLQYAFTWYGLAGTLIVIFGLFFRSRLRQ